MKKTDSGSESDGWAKMSVRKKMKGEIENFIDTDEAEKQGLTNPTQFLDIAIKNALEKYKKKRFEHFNFAENVIRLIDNEKPSGTPYIEIVLIKEMLICRACESKNCIHITEVWNHAGIVKQLKRMNLKKLI